MPDEDGHAARRARERPHEGRARLRRVEVAQQVEAAAERVDVGALAVGQQAELTGVLMFVAPGAGRQREAFQQRQVREPPDLDPFRRRGRVALVHVGRRRERAIDVGERQHVVRMGPAIGDRRVAGGAAPEHPSALVHQHEAAWGRCGRGRRAGGRGAAVRVRGGCPPRGVLIRRQHLTVREADVGVRMAEPALVVERCEHARAERLREIEEPGPPRAEPVRQQVAGRRHLLFGVMRMRAGLPDGD